jgi:hypothetical protein
MTDAVVVYDMITTRERACIMMRKLALKKHAKLGFSYELRDLDLEFTGKFSHPIEIAAEKAGVRVDGEVVGGGDAVRFIVRRAIARA